MHALMWKILRKALRWLWQWLSPWSLLTLHPKTQMPATYASACSAAMYRIWGKGCAWVHNVRRATSAFQRKRWVVGCNHGAKKVRLPRPPLSRWRQVVKKRLAQDDWSGSSYKRSKGQKHRAWSASFRKGVHPRTGKQGMDKPVWWNGEYWIFQPKHGWVRAIQDADPDAEPKASGKAPEPSKEALLRLEEAQEARNQRLEEQERQRHAAEANIGLPTSAKPPVAKKETLVNLYNAASEEGKQLAYNAMAKALAKEPALAPALPKIETPVKAMPPLPPWRQPPVPPMLQNVFAEHMANQLPGMLASALGLPMPPPAKAVNLVIYGNPGPKMLPAAVEVPVPKAPWAKGTFACMCCEWDRWWYHWRRRGWRANQRWLNGSKLQSSSMRWAVIAAAKKESKTPV